MVPALQMAQGLFCRAGILLLKGPGCMTDKIKVDSRASCESYFLPEG